jgi:hypothetical protein
MRALPFAAASLAMSGTLVLGAAPSAGAGTTLGQLVHVIKDQGGGAYYNVTTGERFDVVAASAAPTVATFGVRTVDNVVLTETGQLLVTANGLTGSTPLDPVVTVAVTTGVGAYQSAGDQTQYVIVTAGQAVPAENEFALKTATGALLTVNNKVLIPVQRAAGLMP